MKKVKLEEILLLQKGKKPKNMSEVSQEGYLPYIDIKAFEKGIFSAYADGEKCLPCDDGDLLIVCDGARSGLIGRAKKGYVGSTLAKISATGLINDYLAYFLQSHYHLLNTNVKGSGIPHVNQNLLKNLVVTVPSLLKQERIVQKLEELFSELDKGIEELTQAKARLKVYRQAVLKDAFEGFQKLVPLETISSSRLGKMLDKQKNEGNWQKYLRNINVRWLSFELSDLLEMKFKENEQDKFTITKGDLIVCEGGEPGRCAVWKKDYPIYYQKALHRIRFIEECSVDFYMYYLWFISQTGELNKYFTGTGIQHLTGESLKKILVPASNNRMMQEIIVTEIESRLSVCDNTEQNINDNLKKAENLRQSILKKAFEGGLV